LKKIKILKKQLPILREIILKLMKNEKILIKIKIKNQKYIYDYIENVNIIDIF